GSGVPGEHGRRRAAAAPGRPSDGRRQRRGRLRTGLCGPLHRGHGGRRRGLRPHPSHGDGVRRPDADRRRAADAGDGPPSRC
ncbi:hypothetical protein AJOOGB_AJOOGB_18500, partial [Dysosmobacter welbionis]